MLKPQADREEVTTYGRVGALSVDPDADHHVEVFLVVVTGPPAIGFKSVLVMPDGEPRRGFADVIGRAVFQALEGAEAAQGTSPKAS